MSPLELITEVREAESSCCMSNEGACAANSQSQSPRCLSSVKSFLLPDILMVSPPSTEIQHKMHVFVHRRGQGETAAERWRLISERRAALGAKQRVSSLKSAKSAQQITQLSVNTSTGSSYRPEGREARGEPCKKTPADPR